MQLAIIGFPQSGKTTIFHAVTGGKGEASKGGRAALGVVKVPDPRLPPLTDIFKPKKTTPAEITYLDMPGAIGLGSGKGIEGQFLNDLSQMDALIQVVGVFQQDPAIDPAKIEEEMTAMEMELGFSDMAIIERRLQRLDQQLKRNQDKEAATKEMRLMTRLKEGLEKDVPIRAQEVAAEERVILKNYQLLTGKPLLVVLNISEQQIPKAAELEQATQRPGRSSRVFAICGKLEAELAQMDEADARAFMEDAGIKESSLHRMIRASYEALGLISFLTVGPDEVRAWSIPKGTPAPQAAAKIHSDIERGFIRAEVVSYDDLIQAGGFAEARKHATLRTEGKGYIVRDGDVINFLFNV